jgi:transposase
MQMQKAEYTDEFKEEEVRQVIYGGQYVVDVAKRLRIGDGFLFTLVKKFKAANKLLICMSVSRSITLQDNIKIKNKRTIYIL